MPSPHSHREVELKRLLTAPGDADALIAALGRVVSEMHQINHVFDTADGKLRRRLFVVRLRLEEGQPILTAKAPSRDVGVSTASRIEAEAAIAPAIANDVLGGRRDAVEVLRELRTEPEFEELWSGLRAARQGDPLQLVGTFENVRRTIPVVLPTGLVLDVCIDRTTFPDGRIDEEVEIEMPDEGIARDVEAWFDETASQAGIESRSATPKIARFYEALVKKTP